MRRFASAVAVIMIICTQCVRANDDPHPLTTIAKGVVAGAGEGMALDAAAPIFGGPAVVAYKLSDFALDVASNAVQRQDAQIAGEMVIESNDAALLKALHDQGRDLNTDRAALAARARLRALGDEFGTSQPYGYLGYAIRNNYGYAITKASIDFAVAQLLGKIYKGLFPDADVNRRFISAIKFTGWSTLSGQAKLAKVYVDKLADELIDATLDEFVAQKVANSGDAVLEQTWNEISAEHASKPIPYDLRMSIARYEPALRAERGLP